MSRMWVVCASWGVGALMGCTGGNLSSGVGEGGAPDASVLPDRAGGGDGGDGVDAGAVPPDAAVEACAGVDCGGHGRCVVEGSAPVCRCESGFVSSGLRCVPEGCPDTLAGRLTVTTLSVAPERVLTRAGGPFSAETPPILAPTGDRALLAWQSAGGRIRVTPLTSSGSRAGGDLADVEGQELRGFAASESGFAVLLYRSPDLMLLSGFDPSGRSLFETAVVGGGDHGTNGAKWIRREWGDYGRLAFAGGRYAVSFGHAQNWGSRGEHQGDLFRFYDGRGDRVSGAGQFEWGCSHSLDLRIVYDGSAFRQVCLSDCYPTKAIYLDVRARRLVVHEEPSGNCAGRSGARLGGVAALGSTIWVAFVSPEAPGSERVGLVAVEGGRAAEPIWVGDGVHVQLAPYGEGLVLGWQAGDGYLLAELDASGSIVRGPEMVSVSSQQQTDFAVYGNGDVGWSWASGSSELSVARLRACP